MTEHTSQTLHINPLSHCIEGAAYIASPNCDERPQATEIDLIVIHCISLPRGKYNTPHIEQLFSNCLDCSADPSFNALKDLRVSTHTLIRRNGEIIQFVPFNQRAWHAGESQHQGRDCCNDFSIGIELEGTDDSAFETIQYEQLAVLIRLLLEGYPNLSSEKIVGHSDIAPDRKQDPGSGFDWNRLHTLI